jgi:hypothetical protein
MAPAQLGAGAGWVHVRPLRQPSAPGKQPATLLIRPNPQGGSSSLPMIGHRLPASSSFVLARAGRRGAAGAPAGPRPRDGTTGSDEEKPQNSPAPNPAAPAGHRVRPPRPLDNRGLHGCGYGCRWTGCLLFASRGSRVRVSLAPPPPGKRLPQDHRSGPACSPRAIFALARTGRCGRQTW